LDGKKKHPVERKIDENKKHFPQPDGGHDVAFSGALKY